MDLGFVFSELNNGCAEPYFRVLNLCPVSGLWWCLDNTARVQGDRAQLRTEHGGRAWLITG
jgi:hypothetical protein